MDPGPVGPSASWTFQASISPPPEQKISVHGQFFKSFFRLLSKSARKTIPTESLLFSIENIKGHPDKLESLILIRMSWLNLKTFKVESTSEATEVSGYNPNYIEWIMKNFLNLIHAKSPRTEKKKVRKNQWIWKFK